MKKQKNISIASNLLLLFLDKISVKLYPMLFSFIEQIKKTMFAIKLSYNW